LSLIGDLLDLSAIELGQIVLERDRVDLGDCVAASVRLVAARAQQGGIEIRVEPSVSVPTIEGDERKIKQALLNIIANAVKFSGRGALVTIEGSTTDTACAVTIRDTGPGMDAEALDLALTEFGRGAHAAARRVEGSGLGLPLAKSFVEAHGGELTIESEPGAGTSVTLAFPHRTQG
jgi:two-component system cell cycle sensor histidine kinase PleC